MPFQGMIFSLALIFLAGCASPSSVPAENEAKNETELSASLGSRAEETSVRHPESAKKSDNTYLICKASRRRFHYDWSAGSLAGGQDVIDQNNVRYEFRSAGKPAGGRGENLKVGECGWADEALAVSKKIATKSQVTFKSLSDEATQTFYKMKTGKVFKVPVRQTKNGLVAAPGGVSIIR